LVTTEPLLQARHLPHQQTADSQNGNDHRADHDIEVVIVAQQRLRRGTCRWRGGDTFCRLQEVP
jgi:hypothetical protein